MTNLQELIKSTKSHLCVGLDPSWNLQPFYMEEVRTQGAKNFLSHWSEVILEAAKGLVPAVKFQSAFYEQFGAAGLSALETSIEKAKRRNFFVILDAKRGDISSTMQAYGTTAFDYLRADALTINPYMGVDVLDAILPWLSKGKVAYLVWVTSNPTASALQFAETEEGTFASLVYSTFKDHAIRNNVSEQLGFVCGATKMDGPTFDNLENELLLIPGIGPQGGKIDSKIKQLLTANPSSLYNISRGITDMPLAPEKFNQDEFYEHCLEKIKIYK